MTIKVGDKIRVINVNISDLDEEIIGIYGEIIRDYGKNVPLDTNYFYVKLLNSETVYLDETEIEIVNDFLLVNLPSILQVKLKKLSDSAQVPQYATSQAACFDLFAAEGVVIQPGETKAVGTGLVFEIPDGYQMKIHPRSGISLKTPLRIANAPGCVDSDFRAEVKVLLWHTGERHYMVRKKCKTLDNTFIDTEEEVNINCYYIRKGDRIAQAEIVPVIQATFETTNELSETERGEGGFGSSGTR